ncbi:MAG: phosphoglycerate kinase [Candidatus Bathyarchaeota archaeon]|nr:phosphoglycerate kinase [Candidatus Bathyarchaeum tardum]WGM90222.1 MAG: phosphoglycerate kinase [Candidatus Bathyarchaeum tardum]
MAKFLTLDDFDLQNKTVLLRVDFNSPLNPKTKQIINDKRIRAHANTTIKELIQNGAKTVILAHQGRPGDADFTSLDQHAELLGNALNMSVDYVDDVLGESAQNAIKSLKSGEVLVLGNVRGIPSELKKGTPEEQSKTDIVKTLAPLVDLFVNDAFAAAHRAQVTIIGFTPVLPSAAGRIMEKELKALGKVLGNPEKPSVFMIGGAKGDDSLDITSYVLKNNIADNVLTGGVISHIFLVATGVNLGESNIKFLEKKELMGLIPGIKEIMKNYPGAVVVPVDVATEVNKKRHEVAVSELPIDSPLFDIGTETAKKFGEIIRNAKTVVVSGPVGVFENPEFRRGSEIVLQAVADCEGFTLIGGGHTIAAVEKLGLADKISYISTAGGALIEFLMGNELPGVAALEQAANRT